MVNLLAIAFCLLSACSTVGSTAAVAGDSERGRVFYFGFEIERITGIPESQIQEYGCEYSIDRNDFHSSLLSTRLGDAVNYNKSDVRAKIEFRESIYFVDRQGVVKTPNGYAIIDKAKFVKSLELVGCR